MVCFQESSRGRSVTPHPQKQCNSEIPYLLRLQVDIDSPAPLESFLLCPPESPPSDSSANYRNPASPRPSQHRFSQQQGSSPDSTASSMPARGGCGPSPSMSRPRAAHNGQPSSPSQVSTSIHLRPNHVQATKGLDAPIPSHPEAGSRKSKPLSRCSSSRMSLCIAGKHHSQPPSDPSERP